MTPAAILLCVSLLYHLAVHGYANPLPKQKRDELTVLATSGSLDMVPGDTFEYHCWVHPYDPSMTVEIIKPYVELKYQDEYTRVSFGEGDGVYHISQNLVLNPMAEGMSDRYSIRAEENSLPSITYYIDINDVRPEDFNGPWICRVVENVYDGETDDFERWYDMGENDVILGQSEDEIYATVEGPLRAIDIVYTTADGEHTSVLKNNVDIDPDDGGILSCVVNFTNVEPKVKITIDNDDVTDLFVKTASGGSWESQSGGLVMTESTIWYNMNSIRVFDCINNRKKFKCQASPKAKRGNLQPMTAEYNMRISC